MREIAGLQESKQNELKEKIAKTVNKFQLTAENSFEKTFSCPLFEKEVGCLIHPVKPVPCIQHACYERREDLPPDKLQEETEAKIDRLNQQTFGQAEWLPLPLWLQKLFDA